MQPMQPMQPIMVQSLPGLPPLQQIAMPGVSIQISNVVGPSPGYPMVPHPYGAPPPQPMVARAPEPPGVVDVMRRDAAERTMDAVQRRGPARMLGYTIGFAFLALMAGMLLLLPLGVPLAAVILAEVPCAVIALVALVMGGRAGRGVGSHHLEQAILRVAAAHEGVLKVVALAQATGRPLRECQTAIDAMVASGHATVDSDERGALFYRIPDLEPARRTERAPELR